MDSILYNGARSEYPLLQYNIIHCVFQFKSVKTSTFVITIENELEIYYIVVPKRLYHHKYSCPTEV